MYKGVTPTYTFKAPEGLDMTQATKVWVTFSTPDEREILTKTGDSTIAVVIGSGGTQTTYLKINGHYTSYTKLYKKINGHYTLQSSHAGAFESGVNYLVE